MKSIGILANIMLKEFNYKVLDNKDIEYSSNERKEDRLEKFPQIFNFENLETSIEFNRFLLDKFLENNFNVNSNGQEVTIGRIKSLRNSLIKFLNWLTANQINWKDHHYLKYELPIYKYRNYLIDEIKRVNSPIKYSTANTNLGDVRMLYEWAKSKNVIEELPFSYQIIYAPTSNNNRISSRAPKIKKMLSADITIPKKYIQPSSKELSAYTEQEYNLLINSEYCQAKSRQLWIKLAKEYGLRRIEIANLNQDILNDEYKGTYKVTGKFQKQRGIYFKEEILEEIKDYCNSKSRKLALNKYYENKGFTNAPPLFLNNKGDRINEATISNIIYPVKDELGNKGFIFDKTFHDLRATYAVNRLIELLKDQVNLDDMKYALQDELGHTLFDTTKRYLRVNRLRGDWSHTSGAGDYLSKVKGVESSDEGNILDDLI